MNYLLDTHLLVWSALGIDKLSPVAKDIISKRSNALYFSAASLWEAAIMSALRRPDFPVEVGSLRAGLLANGYQEISVVGRHILAYRDLPAIHRDPFDRLIVAQARCEGIVLLTADRVLGTYGHPVQYVG